MRKMEDYYSGKMKEQASMIESLQAQLQQNSSSSVKLQPPAEIVIDSNSNSVINTTVVGFNNMFSKRGFTGISKYKTPDIIAPDAAATS